MKKIISTKTSKQNRKIIINAVNKEYIVYGMSTYGSYVTFDFSVKNPNVDFDISKTVGLKDSNVMN